MYTQKYFDEIWEHSGRPKIISYGSKINLRRKLKIKEKKTPKKQQGKQVERSNDENQSNRNLVKSVNPNHS